jgi:3-oxoacyl-[acyl-carrier protein] reductase
MVAHGRGGSVVFVGSVNGRFGHRGHSAYGAAKAGVEMLARVAALEFAGAGIRVNAVAPGIVESGMTAAVLADDDFVGRWSAAIPLGRFGRPDDIADVITFLLSRRSRWINGQVIAVDGGASLRVEPKIGPDEDWTLPAIQRLVAADGAGDPEPAGLPARHPQPRPGG